MTASQSIQTLVQARYLCHFPKSYGNQMKSSFARQQICCLLYAMEITKSLIKNLLCDTRHMSYMVSSLAPMYLVPRTIALSRISCIPLRGRQEQQTSKGYIDTDILPQMIGQQSRKEAANLRKGSRLFRICVVAKMLRSPQFREEHFYSCSTLSYSFSLCRQDVLEHSAKFPSLASLICQY